MSSTGTRLLTCLLALSLAMAAASRAMKVVGVSGSLRAASVNTQLLHIIQKNVAAGNVTGMDFSIADISALPLYNADLESSEVGAARCEAAAQQLSQLPHRRRAPSQGGVTKFPEAVEAFRAQLKDADAFIFACTECVAAQACSTAAAVLSRLPPLRQAQLRSLRGAEERAGLGISRGQCVG